MYTDSRRGSDEKTNLPVLPIRSWKAATAGDARRFVKTPLIVDVNYYLNERHPASEESCQYHGDLHTGEMGGGPDRRAPYEDVEKAGWPGSKAAAAPKAKAGKNGRPGKKASEAPVSRNQSAGSGRSASRPGRGWAPVWILAAAAAAVIMASGRDGHEQYKPYGPGLGAGASISGGGILG